MKKVAVKKVAKKVTKKVAKKTTPKAKKATKKVSKKVAKKWVYWENDNIYYLTHFACKFKKTKNIRTFYYWINLIKFLNFQLLL